MTNPTWSIPDSEDAPTTLALLHSLRAIHSTVAAAPIQDRTELALNGLFEFAADLVSAVYKLETGREPVVRFADDEPA